MGRFFSILIATFISVLGALATWHFAQAFLAQQEAEKVAAAVNATQEETKKAVGKIVDQIKYEWKVEERTNPVTGEKVATATRFSEDIASAVTFRCYGLNMKRFDVLISFPNDVDWNSYKGDFHSEMKFRVDDGELSEIQVDRSSSSVVVPDIKEVANAEKEYSEYPSLLKAYRENNKNILEFKRIGNASKFAATIPDGTIYQQTISIDLEGVQEAIKPVLDLCGKDSI